MTRNVARACRTASGVGSGGVQRVHVQACHPGEVDDRLRQPVRGEHGGGRGGELAGGVGDEVAGDVEDGDAVPSMPVVIRNAVTVLPPMLLSVLVVRPVRLPPATARKSMPEVLDMLAESASVLRVETREQYRR